MGTVCPNQPEQSRGGRGWIAVAALFVFIAMAGWISVLTLPSRQQAESDGAAPGTSRRPNVVIFVIDTLRADRLGVYGYPEPTSPNLDALASECVVFSSCYAPAPWTLPSVVSLMTSTFPCEHGVVLDGQRVGDSLSSLAEWLSQVGYATASFYANPYAGPMSGLDRGFDQCSFHKSTDGPILSEWLSTNGATPFFAYIHNIEPHDPFVAPERLVSQFGTVTEAQKRIIGERLLHYRRLTRADFAAGRPIGTTDNSAEQEKAIRAISEYADEINVLYSAAVREADEKVGSVIAALKDQGVWENTLFIVLSDHGEEFFDHGGWQHDQSVYEELVRVPLMVRFPQPAVVPREIDRVVSLVDVSPTVLDFVGHLKAMDHCRGRSLLPDLAEARQAEKDGTVLSDAKMFAPSMRINRKKYFKPYLESRGDVNIVVRDGAFKGIYNVGPETMELYDLRHDPAEQHDVAGEHAAVVARLTSFAAEWLRGCVRQGAIRGAADDPRELDDAVRDRLRSLGYVE